MGVRRDQFQRAGKALVGPFDGAELVHRNIDGTRHVSRLDEILESALQVLGGLEQVRPLKRGGLGPG